jgi:hypothetical protein
MLNTNTDPATELTSSIPLDASGFRIILLIKDYSEEDCLLFCLHQKTLIQYAESLLRFVSLFFLLPFLSASTPFLFS